VSRIPGNIVSTPERAVSAVGEAITRGGVEFVSDVDFEAFTTGDERRDLISDAIARIRDAKIISETRDRELREQAINDPEGALEAISEIEGATDILTREEKKVWRELIIEQQGGLPSAIEVSEERRRAKLEGAEGLEPFGPPVALPADLAEARAEVIASIEPRPTDVNSLRASLIQTARSQGLLPEEGLEVNVMIPEVTAGMEPLAGYHGAIDPVTGQYVDYGLPGSIFVDTATGQTFSTDDMQRLHQGAANRAYLHEVLWAQEAAKIDPDDPQRLSKLEDIMYGTGGEPGVLDDLPVGPDSAVRYFEQQAAAQNVNLNAAGQAAKDAWEYRGVGVNMAGPRRYVPPGVGGRSVQFDGIPDPRIRHSAADLRVGAADVFVDMPWERLPYNWKPGEVVGFVDSLSSESRGAYERIFMQNGMDQVPVTDSEGNVTYESIFPSLGRSGNVDPRAQDRWFTSMMGQTLQISRQDDIDPFQAAANLGVMVTQQRLMEQRLLAAARGAAPAKQPFKVPLHLKSIPDYKTIATDVQNRFRQEMDRDPRPYELDQLAAALKGYHQDAVTRQIQLAYDSYQGNDTVLDAGELEEIGTPGAMATYDIRNEWANEIDLNRRRESNGDSFTRIINATTGGVGASIQPSTIARF
jgi:hypothetical protein